MEANQLKKYYQFKDSLTTVQEGEKIYNLERRTTVFAENILIFIDSLTITIITEPLIKQLIRSSTSIGANYMEANASFSKKDFKYKISICRKEAKETVNWLNLLGLTIKETPHRLCKLKDEANELLLIFSSIFHNTKMTSE